MIRHIEADTSGHHFANDFFNNIFVGETEGHQWFWQWASYQIRKIVGCACTGNAGSVFPATDFKGDRQLVIPACITARASRTCRDACRHRLPAMAGKTFPTLPAHAQPSILHIWQEAHGLALNRGQTIVTIWAHSLVYWSTHICVTRPRWIKPMHFLPPWGHGDVLVSHKLHIRLRPPSQL